MKLYKFASEKNAWYDYVYHYVVAARDPVEAAFVALEDDSRLPIDAEDAVELDVQIQLDEARVISGIFKYV